MNKTEISAAIAEILRENHERKVVHIPKVSFYISDDYGNQNEFSVKPCDKSVVYTKDDVEKILNALSDVVFEALKRGDYVRLKGIGMIYNDYRPQRLSCNFTSGENITIPARHVPKFKFGQRIKAATKLCDEMLKLNNDGIVPPSTDISDSEYSEEV